MDWRDYIDSDPGVIGGKPRVKGTRLGVAFLLELFAAGWTREEVLASYPHLTPEMLRAAFAYAADSAGDGAPGPPPLAGSWGPLLASLAAFTPDFPADRPQFPGPDPREEAFS